MQTLLDNFFYRDSVLYQHDEYAGLVALFNVQPSVEVLDAMPSMWI